MKHDDITLLFADDNKINTDVLAMLHEHNLYTRYTSVADGIQCTDHFATHNDVDILYIDLLMPGKSGFEVMQFLRSHHYFRNIFIVCQTGKTEPEVLKKAIACGGDFFLGKPFREDALITLTSSLAYKTRYKHFFMSRHLTEQEECEETYLQCRTPEEAKHAALALGSLFEQNPIYSSYYLFELIINAIEFGILDIDRDEKQRALRANNYTELLDQKLALPQYQDKHVDVIIANQHGHRCVIVKDCGPGFDPKPYFNLDVPIFKSHIGHSIFKAREFFPIFGYNEEGNAVTVGW